MKPVLKGIYTTEMDEFESFSPQDPARVATVMRLMIGPDLEQGAEAFDVTICTQKWLEEQLEPTGYFMITKKLVVSYWQADPIKRAVEKILSSPSFISETWQEIARKLSTISYWEFEDYRESIK
jgi:Immunity protein 8